MSNRESILAVAHFGFALGVVIGVLLAIWLISLPFIRRRHNGPKS